MEERAKRCTALDGERKSLAASIEDATIAFDESLAGLTKVIMKGRTQMLRLLLLSCFYLCVCFAMLSMAHASLSPMQSAIENVHIESEAIHRAQQPFNLSIT